MFYSPDHLHVDIKSENLQSIIRKGEGRSNSASQTSAGAPEIFLKTFDQHTGFLEVSVVNWHFLRKTGFRVSE